MATDTSQDIAVHPLVLLNISDFQTRLQAQHKAHQPCVGICLGSIEGRHVSIQNSFALNQTATELDTAHLTTQLDLYKQTFPTLEPVAVFAAAQKLNDALIQFHSAVKGATANCPFLLVLDTAALSDGTSETEIPLKVYDESCLANPEMKGLSWRLETHEAERIAVDHVSRAPNTALAKPSKVEDDAQSSQAQDISYLPSEESDLTFLTSQSNAIRVLQSRLQLLRNYVADVRQGKIEGEASLLLRLQAVLARLPQKDESEEKQDAALQAEQQDSATEVALVTLLSDMMALSTNMSALVGDMNEAQKARGPGNAAAQGLPSALSRHTFDTGASRHGTDFSAMVYD